jgi:hypothetical protein
VKIILLCVSIKVRLRITNVMDANFVSVIGTVNHMTMSTTVLVNGMRGSYRVWRTISKSKLS